MSSSSSQPQPAVGSSTSKRTTSPASEERKHEEEQMSDEKPGRSIPRPKKPISILVIGMAGSGKTTLMHRLNAYAGQHKFPGYSINLDPAVMNIPYGANIDIRDTVNYKEVMKEYKLGPNGGILTSLNLFTTRFNQVVDLIKNKSDRIKYVFLDTPGQIEVFTWSASGNIITETLAAEFPTVILYVIDTKRSDSPITFMSNMMYACSIFYKMKLPFILCFNKTDIVSHDFAIKWMQDCEEFEKAVNKEKSYMATLSRSMGLALEEFYKTLRTVGVSAITGTGMKNLFECIDDCAEEYYETYVPMREQIIRERQQRKDQEKAEQIEKMKQDLQETKGHKVVLDASEKQKPPPEDEQDDEDYAELMSYLNS